MLFRSGLGNKEYVIDLNSSPSTRYNEVIRGNEHLFKALIEAIKKKVPKEIQNIMVRVFNTITKIKYKEYAEEIIGMSKSINGTSIDIFIMNCILELLTMCTSIVAQDPNNKVILARNFDFPFTGILRKMHFTFIYKKNNKELFRCGNVVGNTGIFTCLKPNAFSISLNARMLNNTNEMINQFMKGMPLLGWVLRETMINAKDYKEAVKMVRGSKTVSGGYIIIAGIKKDEGCVITKNRNDVAKFETLSDSTWFLAQCNNDPSNATDVRTVWAKKEMKKLGRQNVNLNNLVNKLLLKIPLLNNNTVAIVSMSPIDKFMDIIIANNSYEDMPIDNKWMSSLSRFQD